MNPDSEEAPVLGADLRLRPESPRDGAFLFRLFAETHGAALLLAPLDDAGRRALLDQQSALHERALRERVPSARRWIVERDRRPVGRLVVEQRAGYRYLADIALLPECQGEGLGGRLVEWLKREAGRAGETLTLKARREGRALAFYLRHGFTVVGRDGGQLLLDLRWRPSDG